MSDSYNIVGRGDLEQSLRTMRASLVLLLSSSVPLLITHYVYEQSTVSRATVPC